MVYCSFCYKQLDTTGACPYCQTGTSHDLVKKVIPVINTPAYDIMLSVQDITVTTKSKTVH